MWVSIIALLENPVYFYDSVLLEIIIDLVIIQHQLVSFKDVVKPRGSCNLSGMSIFLKFYHSWCWILLYLSFITGIYYPVLGLDKWVSLWDDYTVSDIYNFYAHAIF